MPTNKNMMSNHQDIVIVSAKRTPVGSFQGSLSSISASELGSIVIKSIIDETGIETDIIDEVIMGNVLSAGQGQAPARQAAISAGLPNSVQCLTINKMCGSGLKSVMLAAQAIQSGDANIIIAGGMENMSQAPYLLPKGREGLRLGHDQIIDSMIIDGLWDVYNDKHMGVCAEICASEKNYTRESQDLFAKESYVRAQAAQSNGFFNNEIVPVMINKKKGDPIIVETDEEPKRANFEKMKLLKPVFNQNGTITAANASKINDGAAALLVMTRERANEIGLQVMATIVSQSSSAQAPEWFTTAPIGAISNIFQKESLNADNIDLWEINEAFAVVPMAAIEKFNLNHEKVNVNGGAIALGHPIGASGARILTTLIYSMKKLNVERGVASLCIGGGEASALLVERKQ